MTRPDVHGDASRNLGLEVLCVLDGYRKKRSISVGLLET